jgi:hypothetical protein
MPVITPKLTPSARLDAGTISPPFRSDLGRDSPWVGRETAVRGRKTVGAKVGENSENHLPAPAQLAVLLPPLVDVRRHIRRRTVGSAIVYRKFGMLANFKELFSSNLRSHSSLSSPPRN